VLSGRPGIGKTALIGRLLEFLEGRSAPRSIEFSYLFSDGSVPLSPDLIRAHLGDELAGWDANSADGRRGVQRILVLDRVEILLDDDCDWRSSELGAFLRSLATRVTLILVSRHRPCRAALAGTDRTDIELDHGLPPSDARRMLTDADRDGKLGLRDSHDAVDAFVQKANGNPRALELILAALVEDPLLDPAVLAADLAGAVDIASQLLSESYLSLDPFERNLIALLTVAQSAVPVSVLESVLGGEPEFADNVRCLALKGLIKIDRVGKRILLDAFDAAYALRHLVDRDAIKALHAQFAAAAASAVLTGELRGTEADTWAIGAVEHYLAAAMPSEAATVLDTFQSRRLEPRGIYDQLIRLRRRLLDQPGELPQNRSRLIRLLYLSGSNDEASALSERWGQAFVTEHTPSDKAEWQVEVALVLGDVDRQIEAMGHFRRAIRSTPNPQVMARALGGAAQIARRRGYLDLSTRWLLRSIEILADIDVDDATTLQIRALAFHQLAMAARFKGRATQARDLLLKAREISESADDRGGIAYRLSLDATLLSDRLRLDQARTSLQLALGIYDEIGDLWGTAAAALAVASLESDRGDYDGAQVHLVNAIEKADISGNIRVQALAHAVRLTNDRRRGAAQPETRYMALRAANFLDAHGFRLYGRRVRSTIALHDYVEGRTGAAHDPATQVLQLARPYGSGLPSAGTAYSGIAHDISTAIDAHERGDG
jgi:tetratricopeptide (TPR) repeat protein